MKGLEYSGFPLTAAGTETGKRTLLWSNLFKENYQINQNKNEILREVNRIFFMIHTQEERLSKSRKD